MFNKLNYLKNGPKIVYIVLVTLMGIGVAFQLQGMFRKPAPVTSTIPTQRPTRYILPSPTNTPTPTPTTQSRPTTVIPTKPSLFPLHISAIDYSNARPNGLLLDANIKLFTSAGEFIAEKKPSAYIQNGPVGTGGDALFNVPLGKYRAEAESGNKKGSIEIEIDSFEDPQWHSIYLGAKSIRISGRYFVDSNGNMSFDEGEQMLPGKKVYAVVDTEGRLYTAAETTTDEKGYYNLYATISGKYSMQGEAGPGYSPQPSLWASLSGGESITYDIYAKPQ